MLSILITLCIISARFDTTGMHMIEDVKGHSPDMHDLFYADYVVL